MDRFQHLDICDMAYLWDIVPEGTLCSCLRGALADAQEELERREASKEWLDKVSGRSIHVGYDLDLDAFSKAVLDAMSKELAP